MNRSDPWRRQAFFWGLTLGIWALVVLAFTGQLMLARSLNWPQAAKVALIEWLPWAILAPAIALVSVESLSSAPTGSKLRLEFAYDSQWRRIQKTVYTNNGSAYGALYTNRFTYDGWNLMVRVQYIGNTNGSEHG